MIIQSFGLSNDQLCRRAVYETKGVILNDSTIEVFSQYSYWFDHELIKEPIIYRLFKQIRSLTALWPGLVRSVGI